MDKFTIEANLFKLGFCSKYKGFKILVEALEMLDKDKKYTQTTKYLLPELAKMHNVSTSNIISNIERVIKIYNPKYTIKSFINDFKYLISIKN